MNIRKIDLNLLHIFVTVYECKSMTLAAERLYLSQPAVSNAITRLNLALNMTLFVKNSRFIVPTRQADALYLDVKYCLQKIELTLSRQGHFDPATSERTFRIATTNYGEIFLFSRLIPHLQCYAPNIKIIRESLPIDDFSRHLQNGQLDLVLFVDHPCKKDIHKEFISDDSLVLVTGPNHPPLQENLTMGDVIKLDIISFNNECINLDSLFSPFISHPDYRAPRYTQATGWSLFYIVSTTTLAAFTPLLYANIFKKSLPINVHRLDYIQKIKLYLYWRDIDAEDPGCKWLVNLIKHLTQVEF